MSQQPAPASSDLAQPPPTASASSSAVPWSEVRYFHPPSGTTSSIPPPPSTDPEPTASELKSTFLSSSRPPTGPDAPLLTAAARARLYPPKPRKTYTSIRLRLRFPDRSMLEALLPVSATIADVFALLQHHLDPAVAAAAGSQAVLWQTMPRTEWRDTERDRSVRLDSLGWAPNALVNVKWTDDATMNRSSWLKDELRNAAAPVPVPSWDEAASAPASQQQPHQRDDTKKDDGKKPMPKWLKGIVKK
ncbi:uncharacterized protein PFL1_04454 [Pseudozyma flocculosa PF-1]|uniref:UBX domain-containing protein n=1 Tax=Pseudozyma flocculosa PF-1 TaxID=1277687 RepID=A0A061H5F3_9BASI|nr:uncharacterized protein PFL1_04454 [Pseudozyma flocculosa PF-1]EPQ28127.1 hypothetical protein PFL1_04454 [Pseudozyma flocculosa PF-1]